jgi:NAD(P)-dependent dehydrogenase (short-subunit alcohol dehydrogenase family)
VAADVEGAGAECTLVRCDLLQPDGAEHLFAAAGRLTGVVNNAGATFHIGTLAETPTAVIRRTVELNLTAAILVAREAVRALSTAYGGPGGVLVNISSGAATRGSPGEYVQYAAAKAGVDALTLGLAEEVADQGVRVVGVAPGLVRTGIHAGAGDAGRLERVTSRVPMGRPGEPDEIASAIAWLLGAEAGYCTGAVLRVAGGL